MMESRVSPSSYIFKISMDFLKRESSWLSSPFFDFINFWILEETELTDLLNWLARVFKTDWVKIILEFKYFRRHSVSSLVHPFRLSLEFMVLEDSERMSEEIPLEEESTSWGSLFLKKLRVNLELYLHIYVIRSLKDLDQNS